MELVYKVGYNFIAFCAISFAAFVLWKNPRSSVNATWALMNLAIATWALGTRLYWFETDYEQALLLCRISLYAAAFIPVFFAHFCLRLVGRSAKTSPLVIAGYSFCILLSGFFLTSSFAPGIPPKLLFPHYVDPGPMFIAFTVEFFTLVIYGEYVLFRYLHTLPANRHNQVRWVAIGMLVAFACGGTCFLLVYNIPMNPWPSLFIPFYHFCITYAIIRHQLMDIRIVIRKSLVYSVLIGCITASYLVAVLVMEKWFQGFFGYRSIFATAVVAFLIAVFFNPLRDRIQAFVDRALFKATPAELAEQREQLLTEVRKGEQMKAVATLAAGLAHEIKNPLASIKTFTEYLQTRHDDPEFRAKFQKIVGGEVERINLIVQQLLEFAKPVPPKLTPLEVPRLLDETLEFLGGELLERHVEVNRRYEAKPRVLGDPQQLKQVFLNLFLNSLQAMNGHGRLDIQTTVDGAELTVAIADSGSGIAAKDLPHIFEPFYTTKTNGTGLGLAVVQGIIKEHGGRIAVESQPGQGTTMRLHLPIAV
jgi:signal transduction histidine kinase